MRIKHLFFVVLFCLSFATSQSQVIYEDTRSMIYPYLTRLADKGLVELQDVILTN